MIIVDNQQQESIAVFGKKDGTGNLTSVDDIVLIDSASGEGVNLYLSGDTTSPEWTLEHSDGNKAKFTNYNPSSQTADVSYIKKNGDGEEEIVQQSQGVNVGTEFAYPDTFVQEIEKFAIKSIKNIMGLACDNAPPIIQWFICDSKIANKFGFEDVLGGDPICMANNIGTATSTSLSCMKSIRRFNPLPCFQGLWDSVTSIFQEVTNDGCVNAQTTCNQNGSYGLLPGTEYF